MPLNTPANFAQFFNSGNPSVLTGVDEIANLARQINYSGWLSLMEGQSPFNNAQGGTSIIDVVKVNDTLTFGAFTPSDLANIRLTNTTQTMTFPWRFNRSHVAWNKFLLALNTAGASITRIKNYKKSLKLDQKTEHIRGLDQQIFARPDYTLMEAPTAQGQTPQPYSLLAWIREDTVRFLPPSTAWGTATLAGQNPQLQAWMQNKVVNYTPGALADPFFGIFAALDNMGVLLNFSAVPGIEGMDAVGPDQLIIFTNQDGITTYEALCRASQSMWRDQSDPKLSKGLNYNGIKIRHASRLDQELLEQTIGTNAAYAGTPYAKGKPRYLWVNKMHTRPVVHESDAMAAEDAYFLPDRPDTYVSWMNTSYNLACNAPNWNGIVAPAQVAV